MLETFKTFFFTAPPPLSFTLSLLLCFVLRVFNFQEAHRGHSAICARSLVAVACSSSSWRQNASCHRTETSRCCGACGVCVLFTTTRARAQPCADKNRFVRTILCDKQGKEVKVSGVGGLTGKGVQVLVFINPYTG